MKTYFRAVSIAIVSMAIASNNALSQSTFHDPVPTIGNSAESTAGTMTINSTLNPRNQTSPAEFARRKSHVAQSKNCRENALKYPAGSPQRKAERAVCKEAFAAQKATWYVRSLQAK